MKVAGTVILYNPPEDIETNINTYIAQIEKLYVIDNSEKQWDSKRILLFQNPNVVLIRNNENIGIAKALNRAAEKAISEGFDYLLTMDQDSWVSDNLVVEMLKEYEKDESLGILAPFVVHDVNPQKPIVSEIEKIQVAITSGCIIRLSAFKKTGEFLEKLFIDYVDNEFCLRLQLAGYKVYQINTVYVYHNLGDSKPRSFLFLKVYPTNHSAIRYYYRTRNRLFVYNKYGKLFPGYVRIDKFAFLKEFTKILLFESNKIGKVKMIIKGFIDYKNNRYGKLQ